LYLKTGSKKRLVFLNLTPTSDLKVETIATKEVREESAAATKSTPAKRKVIGRRFFIK
jgi:hypothetical protein